MTAATGASWDTETAVKVERMDDGWWRRPLKVTQSLRRPDGWRVFPPQSAGTEEWRELWERKRRITPTLHRRKTTGSREINSAKTWGGKERDGCVWMEGGALGWFLYEGTRRKKRNVGVSASLCTINWTLRQGLLGLVSESISWLIHQLIDKESLYIVGC